MEATRNRWEWRAGWPVRGRRWWRWMVVAAVRASRAMSGRASPVATAVSAAEHSRERFRDEARAAVREAMRM